METSQLHRLQNSKGGQKYNPQLSNLLNISAKFAGMGGSHFIKFIVRYLVIGTQES